METVTTWPEVFTNPDFSYGDNPDKEKIYSDLVIGMRKEIGGDERPENFMGGIRKINSIIGLKADLAALRKWIRFKLGYEE
jgi:hypothetical protein